MGRVPPLVQYSKKSYCEESFVQQQIEGLHNYLQTSRSARPEPPPIAPGSAATSQKVDDRVKSESSRPSVQVLGPDDLAFVIEPYPEGYVWKVRNDRLKSVPKVRVKIVSVQSFDARKLAFSDAIPLKVQWGIKNLGSREITKSIILVRVTADHLEISERVGICPLEWPSGDSSVDQRWLLRINVTCASQEWTFELDLWWTHGTKTLFLAENFPSATAASAWPFPADDSRNVKWAKFFDWARKRLSLCLRDGVPDLSHVISRFDRLAEEALGLFLRDERDLESCNQILLALSECASEVIGTQTTELGRFELCERRKGWESIAREQVQPVSVLDRKWNIGCADHAAGALLRQRFERLAAHAAETEMQTTFKHLFQGVDAWLDLLWRDSPYAHGWKITRLVIASAEHCAELSIRALKASGSPKLGVADPAKNSYTIPESARASKANILGEIERQFRGLFNENPRADLSAIHRGSDDTTAAPRPSHPPTLPETANAGSSPDKTMLTETRPEPRGASRKGDVGLLRKSDGTFYESVDFPTAEKYAGISSRRRQQLMTNKLLDVVGRGQNRRITAQSLIAYCPAKEDAK